MALTGVLHAVRLEAGPGVGDAHAFLGVVADLEGLVAQSLVMLHLVRLDVDGRLAFAGRQRELF